MAISSHGHGIELHRGGRFLRRATPEGDTLTTVADLLARGRDITVFATEILGLDLNRAQERWFRYIQPDVPGWEWRYQRVIHVAGNRTGKTLAVAILILWACIYKIGRDFTEPGFDTYPYHWAHVAPTQAQAYHPLRDIRLLIKGAHPAQQKTGRPLRLPDGLVTEIKIDVQFEGLRFANGATAQFRTSADKAAAILGYTFDGITFDEAAFEDHLIETIDETLMMRLITTNGPLFPVSTPNGRNDFFEIVEQVKQLGDQPEDMVWVDRERRWALCWSTVDDNVGFGITPEAAAAMELSLGADTKEQQLRGAFLDPKEAFFLPQVSIIASMGVGESQVAQFARKLPRESTPLTGHRYVIFWDPSVSNDPTACIVIDVTKDPWVGVAERYFEKPLDTTRLLYEIRTLHTHWNGAQDRTGLTERSKAITGFDSTAMGGKMWADMLRDLRPNRPFDFAGSDKKTRTLIDLRNRLATGRLILPVSWQGWRQEVISYRLDDKKIRNDRVMALAGAVAVATQGMNSGPRPFDVHARVGYRR